MGQHKHNLTAIFAKEGLLPPKDVKLSKREAEYRFQWEIFNRLFVETGIAQAMGPHLSEYLGGDVHDGHH